MRPRIGVRGRLCRVCANPAGVRARVMPARASSASCLLTGVQFRPLFGGDRRPILTPPSKREDGPLCVSRHEGSGGMITVDTTARVRRAYFVQKRTIKAIARE